MNKKKINLQKLLAPAALVILYVFFSVVGNNFFTLDTAKNILESSYYIGLMAFGVTFIIITGGIDLSLGTVMMCPALLGAYSFKVLGLPLIISVIITVLVGVVFGVINGFMVAKLKLPPFIATLGTQYVSMGLGSIITSVQSQTWPTATDPLGGWFKKVFIRAELFGIKGFPVGAFWLVAFFIIASVILHKTKFGRYTYAIGSNEFVAKNMGINVDLYKVIAFVLSGLFLGLMGVLTISYGSSMVATTGMASMSRNFVPTMGCFFGVAFKKYGMPLQAIIIGEFVINIIFFGFIALGAPTAIQDVITGLALLIIITVTTKVSKGEIVK